MPRITHDSIMSCGYFKSLLVPRARCRIIRECVAAIRTHCPHAEAVAFTGVSGSLIGPPVADRLRLPMIVVRKLGASTHSNGGNGPRRVEGCYTAPSYVVVDDFVETGNTIRTIRHEIRQWWEALHYRVDRPATPPRFLGVVQALHDEYTFKAEAWLPAADHPDKFGPVDPVECPAPD